MDPVSPATALVEHFARGGLVLVVIFAVGVALWTSLVLRALMLRAPVTALVARAESIEPRPPRTREGLRVMQARVRRWLGQHRRTITTLTAAAPLLGLLGTVHAMVQVFAALGEPGRLAESEALASGIAQALATTEAGLVVALTGIGLGRLLDRIERRRSRVLDALASPEALRLDAAGRLAAWGAEGAS